MEFSIIGLVLVFIIVLIIYLCAKTKNDSANTTESYEPKAYTPPKPITHMNEPVLSTHASERMSERLGVYGGKQEELMKNAFKYGKTSDQTAGDIRIRLEDIERRKSNDEDVIVKYFSGSVFIFASDDNVLKTVYKLDNDYNYHGIYH